MSEILNLAQSFEAKSKQQAQRIENDLEREFERHSGNIIEALRLNEKRIIDDIHVQRQNLKSAVLQTWNWLIVTVALVLAVSWGALWWTGSKIESNLAEIERQGRALEQLKAQTFGIQLVEDDSGRFIVLPEGVRARSGWTFGDRKALKLTEE